MKKTFWFLFWLLAGLLVGSLVASLCASSSIFWWLAYGQSISFSPAADLIVMQFALDVSFSLNLAQILCVLIAMFCNRHLRF